MNRKAFFDYLRKTLHPKGFVSEQVQGLDAMLDGFERNNWPLNFAAYGLATARREVGTTYQPVREGFKKTDAEARAYVKKHYPTKYGKPTVYGGQYAYGRGLVQLTWADPNYIDNYAKADAELSKRGVIKKGELLANFDLALRPDVAIEIMILGMTEGWFTGKKCSDYLSAPNPDWKNARKIINGLDHATEVAESAIIFQKALIAGEYGLLRTSPPIQTPPAPEPVKVTAPPPPVPERSVSWWSRFFGRS